jgi:hypothetical protein
MNYSIALEFALSSLVVKDNNNIYLNGRGVGLYFFNVINRVIERGIE